EAITSTHAFIASGRETFIVATIRSFFYPYDFWQSLSINAIDSRGMVCFFVGPWWKGFGDADLSSLQPDNAGRMRVD
ncbi:MAG: hypothetical protein ACWA5T_09635, partial [Parvularcula sp.]